MIAIRTALVGLLALCAFGCGGVTCYPVKGTVTFNGKPYPDATVAYVPDPENKAITAGSALTDSEGNYTIILMDKAGLAPGKYRVVVTPPAASSGGATFEDEDQRRMALESLGIDVTKQASKDGKIGGEYKAEVLAEPNVLDFDVKGKTAKP